MSVSDPVNTISADSMDCGSTAEVTLSFSASPDTCCVPAQAVLVLDRSSSMCGRAMEAMQAGARQLLSLLESACIGLVSFADTASVDARPTTDTARLARLVDGLLPGGCTNHADAFLQAGRLFAQDGEGRKCLILFTDGETTAGGDPAAAAEAVRAAGAEVFCIGLNAGRATLERWASAPAETHVFRTGDPEKLEELFRDLGGAIACAGARNAVLRETLMPEFRIEKVGRPSHGRAWTMDGRTLLWDVGTAGQQETERPVLRFTVRHVGGSGGLLPVDRSIHYCDRDGGALTFPQARVRVCCGSCPEPEPPCPCMPWVEFPLGHCEDAGTVDLGDLAPGDQGRIVRLSVTLRNICPGRRVALAVLLRELDRDGRAYPRGMKTITVPAQEGRQCRDICVRCITFVVPEDLERPCGCPASLCRERRFRASVLANYIDTDVLCCDGTASLF